MGNNYIFLKSLGDFIGGGSKIIVYEFNSQIGYDNFPIDIIEDDGSKFKMLCTYELTQMIYNDINIIKSLVNYLLIDISGDIYISEFIENEQKSYNYLLEFHSMDETVKEMMEDDDSDPRLTAEQTQILNEINELKNEITLIHSELKELKNDYHNAHDNNERNSIIGYCEELDNKVFSLKLQVDDMIENLEIQGISKHTHPNYFKK